MRPWRDELRTQLRHTRRRLRWARRGRGAVLVYHRVADLASDPWSLAVGPTRFGEQLATLRRVGDVQPLETVLTAHPGADRGRPMLAVTFDDAYADNLHAALPRLEAAACPATLFVAPGLIGRPWYWWDLLAHWAEGAGASVEDLLRGARAVGVLSPDAADALRGASIHDVHVAVYQVLVYLPIETTERRVLDLLADAGLDPGAVDGRPMTLEELHVMAAHPLVSLGVHTMTHPRLSRLPDDTVRREIGEATAWLAERFGDRARALAYPYGDTSPRVAEIAASLGFDHAVTTAGRWLASWDGPLDRPRIQPSDADGAGFAEWLAATA